MTFHPGGQNICGISIGVLSLESYFPKPPGHIKNPSSLTFTTCYEILHGLTVPELLNNPSPAMLEPILLRSQPQGAARTVHDLAQAMDYPFFDQGPGPFTITQNPG